jgi:hypothetical protein
MTISRRRRADLDDDDTPAWVAEPTPPPPPVVPHCTRCGAEGPQLVCDACFAREHAGRHVPETKSEALQTLGAIFTPDPPRKPAEEREQERHSEPVQYHVARFVARGLHPDAALLQSLALVERSDHAAECAVCREHHEVGTRMRDRRTASVQLSKRGMEAILPVLEREIRRQRSADRRQSNGQ